MFTPYVQELFFEFPHLPPATYRIGDWLTVEPGVEIFTCGETHVSNTDIMSIVDGKGILLNRIKSDAVLSTALVDPNIFMYDLLLDLVTASEWRYERLLHHIIDSRNFFKQKNPAWVALMPLAVYQAGNDGKYSRFFDIRDAEQPKGLDSGQRPAFIDSVANEVMPDAQNPYIASWETVGVGSTATPPNWRPYDILDFLNLGYFPTPDRNPT
ncbi:hypothetical protein MMC27_007367 [Xylographa pallens]|nr:hypothetical protein [Xylographa pallens]